MTRSEVRVDWAKARLGREGMVMRRSEDMIIREFGWVDQVDYWTKDSIEEL